MSLMCNQINCLIPNYKIYKFHYVLLRLIFDYDFYYRMFTSSCLLVIGHQ
ncbi:hypothetical protein TpMuguga_01g02035 [Theileria parva strain Muguga]|nr:uncharacterized protein TpMuguga_01g02035 [Theileria parva strain Muguga]KAF5153497.1 hypothetical protein TpMuguga_01g02035 [Theileria parva strain Muguga]